MAGTGVAGDGEGERNIDGSASGFAEVTDVSREALTGAGVNLDGSINGIVPKFDAVKRLGEAEGELEGPAETSDTSPEEEAIPKLITEISWIEVDEECAQLTLGH